MGALPDGWVSTAAKAVGGLVVGALATGGLAVPVARDEAAATAQANLAPVVSHLHSAYQDERALHEADREALRLCRTALDRAATLPSLPGPVRSSLTGAHREPGAYSPQMEGPTDGSTTTTTGAVEAGRDSGVHRSPEPGAVAEPPRQRLGGE